MSDQPRSKKRWYDCIIIREKQKWKAVFDMVINFIVAYNCVMVSLSISFEVESEGIQRSFDQYLVEPMFGLDLIFNFLIEFKDPDT
jgi:hypothetical protein